MSEDIEAIFEAEPVDLEEERRQMHRFGAGSKIVQVLKQNIEEVYLSEDAPFTLREGYILVESNGVKVHIPPELVRRMEEFLEGLL